MSIQYTTVTRVLRFREQAYWVNQVWNFCNDLSFKVWRREQRFLSGYDFAKYTAGATKEGLNLHSQTIQAIAEEYATRRRQFKKTRLAWRVSNPQSAKYSLGWIPFKASALRFKSGQVHFSGIGPLSLWDSYGLSKHADQLGPGSFSEDSRGRWYLNVCVKVPVDPEADAPHTALGIDLGLKDAAVTTDPDLGLDTGWYRALEQQLAVAQRARKKDRVRALHLKIKRRRQDAIHQFTTACVRAYGFIFVGNISTSSQVASGRAKSALDAGWGLLRTQFRYNPQRRRDAVRIDRLAAQGHYQCPEAGTVFVEVNEAYSTVTCSACDSRTGPSGLEGLRIREWTCSECGSHHSREGNAARNILEAGHGLLEGGITALGPRGPRAVRMSIYKLAPLLSIIEALVGEVLYSSRLPDWQSKNLTASQHCQPMFSALAPLNEAFDSLSPNAQRFLMALLLVVVPVSVALALGASFEDESAQALWLVWVLWLLIPRVWYCHATGRSPWRRKR